MRRRRASALRVAWGRLRQPDRTEDFVGLFAKGFRHERNSGQIGNFIETARTPMHSISAPLGLRTHLDASVFCARVRHAPTERNGGEGRTGDRSMPPATQTGRWKTSALGTIGLFTDRFRGRSLGAAPNCTEHQG